VVYILPIPLNLQRFRDTPAARLLMGIETFRYLSRGARCHSNRDVMAGAKKNSRSIRSLYPSSHSPHFTAMLYLPWKSVNETGQIGVVSHRSLQIASTLIGKVSSCPTKTYSLGWHFFPSFSLRK